LPRKVTYSNGNWIEWTYDANGTKLKKVTSAGDTKHYINGIEYDGTVIEAIYHAEGRASLQGSTYRYEYTLRDHPEVNSGQALGNSRVMFADLNSDNEVDETEILQQNHYYPFGMNMEGSWSAGTNKYQYNGKEIDNEFGLDWYHYGARMYDPAIARFTGVDPIASDFPHVTTYNYAENEPVVHIDLWGLQQTRYEMNQDRKFGSKEYAHQTPEQRQGERFTEGAVVAGGLAVATLTAVGGEAALPLLANPLTLETSGTIIATNVAADGMIQTVTNIANGDDPIDNYDVVGAISSALSNPIVGSAIDGVVDITLGGNFEINSAGEAATNTAIGGGLGKAFGNAVQSVQKQTNEALGGIVNFVTGLFTESTKSVATDIIDEN
jgi:RHS repeat-associated protein